MSKLIEFFGFLARYVIAGLALAFVLLFLWPSLRDRLAGEPVAAGGAGVTAPHTYADAVDRAAPSVVSIYTQVVEIQEVSPP